MNPRARADSVGQTRAWVLGLWLALLALCALVIARSTFTADMSAFLPKSPSREQQLLVDQITVGSVSRMILMGLEGGTPEARSDVSLQLGKALRASPLFTVVANGDAEAFAQDQAFLFNNRYLLSPEVTPDRFGVQGLHQAIARSVDGLSSNAGMLLKRIFPRDPTGELLVMVQDLAAQGPGRSDDSWTSVDGQRAILMAQTQAKGSDTDAQEVALTHIQERFAALQQSPDALPEWRSVRLLVSGAPVFSVDARERIRSEASWLSGLGFFAVLALLLWVYRSPWVVGVSILPVLSAVLAGIAAVSLVFGGVHGITVGFGTTLIGEAVDYSIYYFVQSGRHAGAVGQDAQRAWVQRFWPTIRLGVLTSVFGFAALVFSGFPGLAQLGLYSIVGLCVAAGVTRYVLPQLPVAASGAERLQRLGQRLMRGVERVQTLRRFFLILSVLAALAIALALWQRGSIWSQTLSSLSPVPQAAQNLDASLRRDLGQPEMRYLLVSTAATEQTLLQNIEALSTPLQALVREGVISGFENPSRFLPSAKAQQMRREALPAPEVLHTRLSEALNGLPVQAQTLAPFLSDVERARTQPLLTRQDLQGTALALTIDAMLVERHGHWTALLPLRAPQNAQGQLQDIDVTRLQNALQGMPEVTVLDVAAQSRSLYMRYFQEAALLSLSGLLAITVLLAVTLRSRQRWWRVLLPLLMAESVLVGTLVIMGIELTLMHFIGLLLVVAVGSNYTLFFDRFQLSDTDQAVTLASLCVANLATVLGFGVLAFSTVPVLQAVGVTVAPGAVLALIFAAALTARGDTALKGVP